MRRTALLLRRGPAHEQVSRTDIMHARSIKLSLWHVYAAELS